MITCKFMGRLGNHMYQAATAINLAKELNTDFVIPTYAYAGHRGDIPTDFSGFAYDYVQKDISLKNVFNQPDMTLVPIPKLDDTELHGFFQFYQYFDKIRNDLIHKYFAFNNRVLRESAKFNVNGTTLGVSVRRGDYIMLQHNHCVLSTEYYQEALSQFPEVDQLYVFSDDFDWCKKIFGDDAIYVDEDKFVQLHLMTKMTHMILSNSTFAWWGAYLNDNKGKVIVPDPWFGPNYASYDTSGLFYPAWTIQKHKITVI